MRAQSFSRAAEGLGVAKSTVSKQIRALEDRLGVRLLDRTTRRMELTDVGAAFYEQCADVVSAAEEAELAVTQLQPTPRGRLRIAAPTSFGQRFVIDAIDDYLTFYPDVAVDLDLTDRATHVVDEGYDLAIHIGRAPTAGVIAQHLAEARLALVASPRYLADRGTPSTPADLGAHDSLLVAGDDHWTFDGPGGEIRVRPPARLRANNADALAAAATDGLGLAMLPDYVVRDEIAAGRLVSILPAMCRRLGGVFAVYPENRHLSAKVRVFVDLLSSATSFSR